jgi:hypothetical protein
MASLVLAGNTSGSITISSPAVSGTNTLTLPASTGTVVVTSGAQTIEFADGSASTPSITNSGDTNTGIFFSAADTIDFTEGGTACGQFDSSANFKFNSGYGSVATAYGCRAWVKFSGSTGSINGSGNVSSVSDNGTGNFTVNFTTAMPDTNYAWVGTADPTSAQTTDSAVKCVFGKPDTNPTTSAIALLTASSGAGRDDMESVFVSVFR